MSQTTYQVAELWDGDTESQRIPVHQAVMPDVIHYEGGYYKFKEARDHGKERFYVYERATVYTCPSTIEDALIKYKVVNESHSNALQALSELFAILASHEAAFIELASYSGDTDEWATRSYWLIRRMERR